MKEINMDKVIHERTVKDYIADIEPTLKMVQNGRSWMKPIETRKELKRFCINLQSYYKRYIPEVVNYLAQKYNISK